MKTIIAGSRNIKEDLIYPQLIYTVLDDISWEITEVVSGTARGIDRLGERWAKDMGISIKQFPANWSKFGMGAGHIRNAEMAMYADALVAFWDGISTGTANMITLAKARKLKIHIELV